MELNKMLKALAVALLIGIEAHAQVAENRYIVYFTDKDNTPYSLSSPGAFLSQRALTRRANQNIPVDVYDLPVDPAYIASVQALGDVEIIYPLRWSNAILIETTDPDVIQGIGELAHVDRLEVSRTLQHFAVDQKSAAMASPKTDADYGPSLNQIEMLNGVGLHDAGFRGEGMWIAVLDGGFNYTPVTAVLDSLMASDRIIATRNFVDQSDFVYSRSSHGSRVLSTMAGLMTDSLIGTAPQASYILGITEDVNQERRLEEALWEAGAEFADSIGADIINTSLGYTEFDVIEENYTPAQLDGNTALITRMADRAASRGMLVVASAGNLGADPWHYIGFPADGDSVLSVGAVYPNEMVTPFSGRGPSADGRVKPNVMAQGGFTVISDNGPGIQTGNGTSFSSPVLAGMAACLWQKYPAATAWQVFQAIEQSANLFDMPNDSMGYGIPDFMVAAEWLDISVGFDKTKERDQESLKVFPNPYGGGKIALRLPQDDFSTLVGGVVTLSGKTILPTKKYSGRDAFEKHLNHTLPAISAGVYIIFARTSANRVYVCKLVVD